MLSKFTLLPRQYLFQSATGLSASRPRVPEKDDLPNVVKYHIAQLQDEIRRLSIDKYVKRGMKQCNEKFRTTQQQYLETCAYYDELCLRHPLVHTIAEEFTDYPNTHYQDFETRYACRMAELRLLKTKYTQKLTLLKMQHLSYMTGPILNCIFKIAPILAPEYFCYIGYNENESLEILFIVQWIYFWLASRFLNFKNPNDQSSQLVSNIECYIDEVSMKKPDMYLQMGGPTFTNRLTRNYLKTVGVLCDRREAFVFYLVALHFRSPDHDTVKYLQLRRVTAEKTFFESNDLVRLVVSFIMGDCQTNCPVQIMFLFP